MRRARPGTPAYAVGTVISRGRLAATLVDPIRSREVLPMLRRLELKPTDRVLDIGAAHGFWTHYLGKRVQEAIGVDLDEVMMASGRRVYAGIDLRPADARALPFPDEHFDAVVFISTLEHIGEPERALREVTRVLRPGGRLALSVDTLDHPAWLPLRPVHAARSAVVQYFGRDQLLPLARGAGLEPVWGRYIYGNAAAPALLRWRLELSPLQYLAAPAAWLSGVFDGEDGGMMYQSVFRRP